MGSFINRNRLRNSVKNTFYICLVFIALVSSAWAQLTLSKIFVPNTIGPGSVSTITFINTNGTGIPVSDMAFTNVLPIVPSNVVIATPANASTDCFDGIVTAADGSDTITFRDGRLGDGENCTVTVDVTASTPRAHTNSAITLNSRDGSSITSLPTLRLPPPCLDFPRVLGQPAFQASKQTVIKYHNQTRIHDLLDTINGTKSPFTGFFEYVSTELS